MSNYKAMLNIRYYKATPTHYNKSQDRRSICSYMKGQKWQIGRISKLLGLGTNFLFYTLSYIILILDIARLKYIISLIVPYFPRASLSSFSMHFHVIYFPNISQFLFALMNTRLCRSQLTCYSVCFNNTIPFHNYLLTFFI